MNYTEKYHLPQWEESDRVMRTDFNQMCSSIESGLAAGAQGTEAAEELTFERLCRMAYNHYHHVRTLETMPRQLGVFHQKFGTGNANVNGMERRDDCCFMGRGEQALSGEDLYDLFEQVSEMKVVANTSATPLIFNFTAPGPGRITTFAARMDYYNPSNQKTGMCDLTLTNLDTGKVELYSTLDLGLMAHASAGGTQVYPTDIRFHGGYIYQIKIQPRSREYNFTMYLLYDERFRGEVYKMEPAQTEYTFQEDEESSGGIVVVQYNTDGQGGDIALDWDGQEIAPRAVRTVTAGGKTLQEAVFAKDGAIPANSSLRLQMSCPLHGELSLYNWGAVLF